jgi:hypothetical protein
MLPTITKSPWQLSFDFYMIEAKPKNLIGDKACDSDQLDETTAARRRGDDCATAQPANARPKTGDDCLVTSGAGLSSASSPGFSLRRGLLVRREFYPRNFLGFVQLAAICILLCQF